MAAGLEGKEGICVFQGETWKEESLGRKEGKEGTSTRTAVRFS
jgi:hypothetical protein